VISTERVTADDRQAIEALLEANHLPLAGLDLGLEIAVVARDEGRVVGCAGVEPYGSAGLLRSVCVAPDRRGTGIGKHLVAAAESLAASGGISELFLLTETAADWFPRLGYDPATRADVPAAVTTSVEFTGACPVTAAVFRKRI